MQQPDQLLSNLIKYKKPNKLLQLNINLFLLEQIPSSFSYPQFPISSLCLVLITTANNPLAPMGVLAPGSAHARPSARPPIDTSGNFWAHMSGGGWGEIV